MKKARYSIRVNEVGEEVLRIEQGRKRKEIVLDKEPKRASVKLGGKYE
jgi:hypothetical protein